MMISLSEAIRWVPNGEDRATSSPRWFPTTHDTATFVGWENVTMIWTTRGCTAVTKTPTASAIAASATMVFVLVTLGRQDSNLHLRRPEGCALPFELRPKPYWLREVEAVDGR